MKTNRNEERMLILNMVSEGKISVDESVKLLEAISEPKQDEYFSQYDYEMEDKLNKFAQSVDGFARDVSDKLSGTFKDVEPKVKKATKTLVEKTVNVLADITESLNETIKNLDREDCGCGGNCDCDTNNENNSNDNEPREN